MYENSRFLKKRFTFCGVNTNFGQQWAPPAYYHLTHIVSKGKHCINNYNHIHRLIFLWQVHFILKAVKVMSNFRAIQSLYHPISRLQDFTRFGGKTSYCLENRGLGDSLCCVFFFIRIGGLIFLLFFSCFSVVVFSPNSKIHVCMFNAKSRSHKIGI